MLEVIAAPGNEVAVGFEGHDMPEAGRDIFDATSGVGRNLHLAEVICAPPIDPTVSTKNHGVVGADFDLID